MTDKTVCNPYCRTVHGCCKRYSVIAQVVTLFLDDFGGCEGGVPQEVDCTVVTLMSVASSWLKLQMFVYLISVRKVSASSSRTFTLRTHQACEVSNRYAGRTTREKIRNKGTKTADSRKGKVSERIRMREVCPFVGYPQVRGCSFFFKTNWENVRSCMRWPSTTGWRWPSRFSCVYNGHSRYSDENT